MKGTSRKEFVVENLEVKKKYGLLKLRGVETLAAADELVGWEIFAESEAFLAPTEGNYYKFELIGSRVITADGREIGVVEGVAETRAQALLVVKAEGKEILIPFVADICLEIDNSAGMIIIDPPAGLLDLNEV